MASSSSNANAEVERLKLQLALADARLNFERTKVESLTLRATLTARERELEALRQRAANANDRAIERVEDDARDEALETFTRAVKCATCDVFFVRRGRGGKGELDGDGEERTLDEGDERCERCRGKTIGAWESPSGERRASETDGSSESERGLLGERANAQGEGVANLVWREARAIRVPDVEDEKTKEKTAARRNWAGGMGRRGKWDACSACLKIEGESVHTRECGVLKTTFTEGYSRCDRCRLGVKVAASASARSPKSVDGEKPVAQRRANPCGMCHKNEGDLVHTRECGVLTTTFTGEYRQCDRCRLGVKNVAAALPKNNKRVAPMNNEGMERADQFFSPGDQRCKECGLPAGRAMLTNTGVRVVTEFTQSVDVCNRCCMIPRVRAASSAHEGSWRGDEALNARPAAKKNAENAQPAARKTAENAQPAARKTAENARPAARKTAENARPAASNLRHRPTDRDLSDAYVAMHSAADRGDLERCEELRLIFLKDKETWKDAYEWDHELISCVARDGRRPIEVIEWALGNGARITKSATKRAVERTPHRDREFEGHYTTALEVLQFIHSRRPKLIDEETMYCASEFGSLECLKWIIDTVDGCDVSRWPERKTPTGNDNDLMLIAAQNGHVEVMKYLYDDAQCDWHPEDAVEAVGIVMNREPSSPLNWHSVVAFIQSTPEWSDFNDPSPWA